MRNKKWYLVESVAHLSGISEVRLNIRSVSYIYRADSAVVRRFLDMYRYQRRALPALDYLKSFSLSVQRTNQSRIKLVEDEKRLSPAGGVCWVAFLLFDYPGQQAFPAKPI